MPLKRKKCIRGQIARPMRGSGCFARAMILRILYLGLDERY